MWNISFTICKSTSSGLIVKPKIIKLIEVNVGEMLCDKNMSKDTVNKNIKGTVIKRKSRHMGLHQYEKYTQ
jgi:hypothetical protein